MRLLVAWVFLTLLLGCADSPNQKPVSNQQGMELVILGIAQDAGYPQAACQKSCCQRFWNGEEEQRRPACLGVIDHDQKMIWMLEATPAFTDQWHELQELYPAKTQPDGIFLTHAHIGHYAGLIHLGREVMGAKEVPVWAMPRMQTFLQNAGPWSQLVDLGNIAIHPLVADNSVQPGKNLTVTPWQVPHRDEFSETVGFLIEGPEKKVLFLPDIDKWNKWDRSLEEILEQVDLALVDGTFFRNGELPNRDMSKIPHPFVEETMNLLEELSGDIRSKLMFIHFNHTNPLIWDPAARSEVQSKGFRVAEEGMRIPL